MSDEQTKSYDDGEFGYKNIEPKRSKSTITIIGLGLTFVAIALGVLMISYLGLEKPEPIYDDQILNIPEISLDDIPEEELLTLEVTDQLPSALSHMEIDWVGQHMNHLKPSLVDMQNTLHWAKDINQTTLQLIESDILEGAKQNSNKITLGEELMLEIINWAMFPVICEEPPQSPNCEFFDMNYQESRYQAGEITRDEYWLNIRQYANQTVIDQVEGNFGG